MGSYIKYENCPIYLGLNGQAPQTGAAGLNNLIAANSCEISFETQLEPQKFLGKQPVSDDFSTSGPMQAKISVTYTPLVGTNLVSGVQEASLAPLYMTGDSISGEKIIVGNFLFEQCYLDSLNIQINSWNNLKFTAQFQSHNVTNITGTNYSGSSDSVGFTSGTSVPTMYSSLHALSLGVSGNSLSIPESKTEIGIQTTCARTPIYEVGSITPTTVILNSVNRSTSLGGENVGQIVNFSGANAGLSLRFSEFGKLMESGFNPMADYKVAIDILGKVTSQNLSMQPNQVLQGNVSIVENIF